MNPRLGRIAKGKKMAIKKVAKAAKPKRARKARKPTAVTVSAADVLAVVNEKLDAIARGSQQSTIIDTGKPTAAQLIERLRPAIKTIDSVLSDLEASGIPIHDAEDFIDSFEQLFTDITLALVRAP